jgi:hypothetical protein
VRNRRTIASSVLLAKTLTLFTVLIPLGLFAPLLASAAISPSLIAARTSGVAPLAVFFDASDTTDTTFTTRPFHELEYKWAFGDAASGIWTTGSQRGVNSRNAATGPVAAHVFETPGTYTVTLSIYNGTDTVTTTTDITVTDPATVFAGTNTICFSNTTAFSGCPTGATQVTTTDFSAAIAGYQATGKRLLFRRGDRFTTPGGAILTATGPGIVGSFGTGSLPVVELHSNDTDTSMLSLSSRTTPAFSDWRLMDLEFDGMLNGFSNGLGSGGGMAQLTVLRVTLRNLTTAFGCDGTMAAWWNSHQGPYNQSVDQTAIVDSAAIPGANSQYGAYLSGNRLAFMGNSLDVGGNQVITNSHGASMINPSTGTPYKGSHVTRWHYLGKAVIGNNDIMRPGFDRATIKLHAPTWSNGVPPANQPWQGDGYSKQVVISDNRFVDFANPWSVAVGPQNGVTDERVRDIILERNEHVTTPTSQVSQVIRAYEVTIRNNLFRGGGGNGQTAVMINVDGLEPPAHDVRVYNNTQYSADAVPSSQFVMVDIRSALVSDITIKNNLAYAPNASGPLLYANAGATNVVAANNSTNTQVKNANPFIALSPSAIADFRLRTASYAKGSGTPIPGVFSDFLGNRRGATLDIGAFDAQGHGGVNLQAKGKVSEGAAHVVLRVDRTGGTTGAIGVDYTTGNGSALAGADYTTTSGTLAWADGDGSPKVISVPILHDSVTEVTKNFTVTLSNPTGTATLGNSLASVTLYDDDPATPFPDAASSGFLSYVNAIYGAGITTGCGGGSYCPGQAVTRAQMAAFLIRALESDPVAGYCGSTPPFSDVPLGNSFCGHIKRMKELAITTGCGAGNYCPNATMPREQMAAFIVRAVEGEPASTVCNGGSGFADVALANGFCRYIKRLAELGITTGCGGGNFCPAQIVSRDQMAAFIARAFLGM